MTGKKASLAIVFALIGVAVIWFAFSPELTKGDDTMTMDAIIASSVTCSTEPTGTGFGTLTTASIHTATSSATTSISCNYAAGCIVYVKDLGDTSNPGLYSSGAGDLIDSSTATLSAGTEGYGIQAATTSAGSGGTLTLAAVYKKTGDDVGGLAIANQALASSSTSISGRTVVVEHKVAISGLNKAGTYVDTITYECTGN